MQRALLPSLTQVRSSRTDHLALASAHWSKTADLWEESFNGMTGRFESTTDAKWSGAADIASARQRVLSVVARASEAGLGFTDDLTIAYPHAAFPRNTELTLAAQARASASDIQTRAAALATLDEQIAVKINNAMAQLDGGFTETGGCCGGDPTAPLYSFVGSPILVWCSPIGIGFICKKFLRGGVIDIYRSPGDESGVIGP